MKFTTKFVMQRAWNMKFAWNLMNIWNIDVILLSDWHLTSVNPTRNYTRLSLCVCACAKCTLKLCMVMYNYALNLCVWSLTLTYFIVKFFSSDTPRDENILPRTTFTRKYPTVNFPKLWYTLKMPVIVPSGYIGLFTSWKGFILTQLQPNSSTADTEA